MQPGIVQPLPLRRSRCDCPCRSLRPKPSRGTRRPSGPEGLAHPEDSIAPRSQSSRVPSPGARLHRRDRRLQTSVAARRPASPRQPTRSETHACQEWSMTDLNSSTNQPKSRCILPDSPPGRRSKHIEQTRAPRSAPDARCTGPIGPAQRLAAIARRILRATSLTVMNNDDMNLYSIKCPSRRNRSSDVALRRSMPGGRRRSRVSPGCSIGKFSLASVQSRHSPFDR